MSAAEWWRNHQNARRGELPGFLMGIGWCPTFGNQGVVAFTVMTELVVSFRGIPGDLASRVAAHLGYPSIIRERGWVKCGGSLGSRGPKFQISLPW